MIYRLPSMNDIDLAGKRVFLRVDFNVPIENGRVMDRSRIEAALPTIRFCLEQGARLAIASHLGRPKGKPDAEYSLLPVAEVLSEMLSVEVFFPERCVGDAVRKLVNELRPPKELVLLENLRFHAEEEANDAKFASELAAPFDVYLTEAFGTLHRAHASTAGMLSDLPVCAVGPLITSELRALDRIREKPESPFVAILGGAKVSDKIGILEELSQHVDVLVIGGGMAYTFLAAQGDPIGNSLVEESKIPLAKRILKRLQTKGAKLYLPVDHKVFPRFPEPALQTVLEPEGLRIVGSGQAWESGMGLDIGPETAVIYARALEGARTIFWNGPMGVFEYDAFRNGTLAVGRAVASSSAYTVVGGGDSVAAVERLGLADQIDHLSTGGGASLTYLETGDLPGLAAIREATRRNG